MARILPGIATLVLLIALAASVTEWVLRFSARGAPAEPVRTLPAAELDPRLQTVDVAPLARLLGAAAVSGPSDIRALGVVAERGGKAVAVLDVNGRPRTFRAGDEISPGILVKEVRADGVVLSRSGELQELLVPVKRAR
jgi:hypothetical protein